MAFRHRPLFFLFILSLSSVSYATDSITLHKRLKEISVEARHILSHKNDTSYTILPKQLVNYRSAALNDILQMIPSFDSDLEGNIRLRGTDKVSILINGQPTALLGDFRSEVLIQMPITEIDRVEYQDIPEASQLPDGSSGIINIVLKDEKFKKNTGTIGMGASFQDRYNAGGSFGTKIGGLYISANTAYKKEYRDRSFQSTTITNEGKESKMNNTAKAHPQTIFGDIRLQYNLNAQNELGIDGSFFRLHFDRTGNIHQPTARIVRENQQTNQSLGSSIFYRHLFPSEQHLLQIKVNYQKSDYEEINQNTNITSASSPIKLFNQEITQYVNQYNGSILYMRPLFQGAHLDLGYSYRTLESDNENTKNNVKPVASTIGFKTDIEEDIQAVFAQYKHRIHLWLLSAGIRIEYNDRHIYDHSENKNFRANKWFFFPNASIQYKISSSGKVYINYGMRINRPTLSDLNPTVYPTADDPTISIQGNPLLKAESIQSLSLGYEYKRSIIQVSPSFFYRYRYNTISEILTGNILEIQNLHSTQSAGLEINTLIQPVSWARLQMNGTLAYDQILTDKSGDRAENWSCQIQSMLQFDITPSTILQCNGQYISTIMTAQGSIRPRYLIHAGVRQLVFQRRGIISLNFNDIFNSSKEIVIYQTPTQYKETIKKKEGRILWLGFSWTFG